jgi:hypothetical protein
MLYIPAASGRHEIAAVVPVIVLVATVTGSVRTIRCCVRCVGFPHSSLGKMEKVKGCELSTPPLNCLLKLELEASKSAGRICGKRGLPTTAFESNSTTIM